MGSKKESSTTTSHATQDPWARTIPTLSNIISQIDGQAVNTGLTDNEQGALNTLTTNANAGNPFAGRIGMLADDLFTGGPDRTGIVNNAYSGLQESLTPFARGDFVNPNSNPALQGYLGTISDDVTNRIRSQFAAAGRGFSGAETGSIARGVAEGTAPVLANAYENERGRQMAAINALQGGALSTAGMLSGLDQTALGNRQAGIGVSTAAQQAKDSPAERLLQIEAQRRGIPLQNLGMLSNMIIPMAQLGGTSDSTQTTEKTSSQPIGQQILGGAMGGVGLLGQMGAFGPGGWLLSGAGAAGAGAAGAAGGASALSSMLPLLAFSDIRLKEDVVMVGRLNDGQPVYRFRYIGDDMVRLGLMAQDVEKVMPEAVYEVNGFKAVDYGAATSRAAGRAA